MILIMHFIYHLSFKRMQEAYKSMEIVKNWRAPSAHNDAIKGDTHTHTRKIMKFLATIGINTISEPVYPSEGYFAEYL